MARQNNNMNPYTLTDIEKYWKGELTAAEMHAMEMAALDDPFLADAMEGYQYLNQVPAASASRDRIDLENRLNKRISGNEVVKSNKSFWLKPAIAAMALLSAGIITYYLLNPESPKNIVVSDKHLVEPVLAPSIGPDSIRSSDTIEKLAGDIAVAKEKKKQPAARNNLPATAKAEQQKAEAADSITEIVTVAPPETLNKITEDASRTISAMPASSQKAREITLFDYSGLILDDENKPVAGAIVNLKGKVAGVSVVTDTAGRFFVPIADSTVQLTVSSNGYQSDKYQLSILDSTNNIGINLKPTNKALNEVVVSEYSNKKKFSDIAASDKTNDQPEKTQDAIPIIGWKEYQNYLQQKQQVPDSLKNLKGTVALSFVVASNGKFSSFIIEQPLHPELNREAIRLVKAGPGWKILKGNKARVLVFVPF